MKNKQRDPAWSKLNPWVRFYRDVFVFRQGTPDGAKAFLEPRMAHLTQREEMVLRMYYGIDGEILGLEEIGQRYAVTRDRIKQILERAVIRLQLTTPD